MVICDLGKTVWENVRKASSYFLSSFPFFRSHAFKIEESNASFRHFWLLSLNYFVIHVDNFFKKIEKIIEKRKEDKEIIKLKIKIDYKRKR